MADNQSSLNENLIGAGLNVNNPASTYVDFAEAIARNQREQKSAEEALKMAKEHVAQAKLKTRNEVGAEAAGLNPLLVDTMTPQEARTYLKVVTDAKGLEIEQKAIDEWIASLPARVNRNTVEAFASRFAKPATRDTDPVKIDAKQDLLLPTGVKAEDIGLLQDDVDPRFGHVPETGMYQIVYDNQGNIKRYIPGGKETADKDDGLTPFQKKVDMEFAKEYADDMASGNVVGLGVKLGRLKSGINRLESLASEPDSEQLWQRGMSFLTPGLRSVLAPELKSIEQETNNAVLELLRQTLGSQFTQSEGERIFSLTFDAKAPMSLNLERMRLLEKNLIEAAKLKQAAAQHAQQTGSLRDYIPKVSAAQESILALAESFKKWKSPEKETKEAEPDAPASKKEPPASKSDEKLPTLAEIKAERARRKAEKK